MENKPLALALCFILSPTIPLSGRPEASPVQVANYKMDVRLDTARHLLLGKEHLTWRNGTGLPVQDLWFHLYWNAFKNNQTTFLRRALAMGYISLTGWKEGDWGYCRVNSIKLRDGGSAPGRDLLPTLKYEYPDEANPFDETVFSVKLPEPLEDGGAVVVEIDFESRIPRPISNTGVFRDFYFICQWFPKVGVHLDGGWNCHQHQFGSEYFSEYGTYDVSLTLPSSFKVGATGRELGRTANEDGTKTLRFYQESVHDFAWVAYPHFLEFRELFEFAPGKKTEIILLLLPQHRHLQERYLKPLRAALVYAAEAFTAYPYPTITCVDPVRNAKCAGMEYPTLFTGGAYFIAPENAKSPEDVTIHEFLHGYFYGLIGTNEFEHAWMDEGMTSFYDSEVYIKAYGEPYFSKRYFGIPVRFKETTIPVEAEGMIWYILAPDADPLERLSWEYRTMPSYTANVYGKAELLLRTLQRRMGEEAFARLMRTYVERWKFKHPKPADFLALVNEFGGPDLLSLANQILYGSETLDYAVEEITNRPARRPEGLFDPQKTGPASAAAFESEVLVRRRGGVKAPVEILVLFEDGREVRERWDGRYPWTRLRYASASKVKSAVVDPEFELVLDVNRSNNGLALKPKRLGALKWSSRWMFWLQQALELLTVFGG